MGWLLDRTLGATPCIKDRPGPGLGQLYNTIAQQDRQLNRHRSPAEYCKYGRDWRLANRQRMVGHLAAARHLFCLLDYGN